ncbi:UNVERIFIED_CONTAM: Zfp28 [Trichonephila clavipes]
MAVSDHCSLNKDLHIHTKDRPYICHICRTSFSQNCSLERHFRIHTNEKPYEFCQNFYQRRESNLWPGAMIEIDFKAMPVVEFFCGSMDLYVSETIDGKVNY